MTRPGAPPVIGVAGWKNSGKTTLVERLIAELTRRGFKVATVKHAHHNFQIDDAETDSARHRRAGAAQVAIVSPRRWALVRELGGAPEPSLEEVIGRLDPCDLVIVEGYKAAPEVDANVYRLDAATGRLAVVAEGVLGPNGLCFSPDEQVLYVVESRGVPNRKSARHSRRSGGCCASIQL